MKKFILLLIVFASVTLSGCEDSAENSNTALRSEIDDLRGEVSQLNDKIEELESRVLEIEH